MSSLHVGALFHDRYRIESILGEGGSATVYRAVDTAFSRSVALKILKRPSGGYHAHTVSRFQREIHILAQLRNPHTVTMFDAGESADGLLFIACEFIEGADLETLIFEGRPLHEGEVVHILRQLLESLREAHAQGLLHRDIKPVNIRVFEYMGDPLYTKLLDFGIARQYAGDATKITREGAAVGTPQFMAPEQLAARELSPATDIYALGIVAIEMLTGRPVVDTADQAELFRFHSSTEAIVVPAEVQVSADFRAVIERMVRRDPRERFQSAEEVAAALRQSSPPPVSPTAGSQAGENTAHSRRVVLVAVAGVFVMFAGLVAALVLDDALPTRPGDDRARIMAPLPDPGPAPTHGVDAEVTKAEPEAAVRNADLDDAIDGARAAISIAVTLAHDSSSWSAWADDLPWGAGCGKRTDVHQQATDESATRKWVTERADGAYDRNRPHPVVIVFHDTAQFEDLTKTVDALGTAEFWAEQKDLLLVSVRSANPGAVDGDPWAHTDERSYLKMVIEGVNDQFCVDPERIYGIGVGFGGRFLESVRCDFPFAAIATLRWRDTSPDHFCGNGRVVPHMHWAGRSDRYNPIGGGVNCAGDSRIPLEQKKSIWERFNRCQGEEEVWAKDDRYACTAPAECAAKSVFCVHRDGRDLPHGGKDIASFVSSNLLGNCSSDRMRFNVVKPIWKFFSTEGVPPEQQSEL